MQEMYLGNVPAYVISWVNSTCCSRKLKQLQQHLNAAWLEISTPNTDIATQGVHWENLTGLTTKLRQIYVLPIDDATYGKSIRIAYEFEDICSENGSVIPITLLSQPVNKIDSSNDMSDIDKALDADKEWLTINAFKAYVWKWYAWNDKIHTVLSQTRPHTGGQLVPVNLGQSQSQLEDGQEAFDQLFPTKDSTLVMKFYVENS